MNAEETLIRERLGIPDSAEEVLIFAESSHWDPNWLKTADEYYSELVEPNLHAVIEALEAEPRRVYSVECVFFLRMYWDNNPDKQDILRRLFNEGRLRMSGSGVTTADTLLPPLESLLRDMTIGQQWLNENGIDQTPRLMYFTDSFGASPFLPTLLRAAGFDYTAITRLDGMYFVGCDLELGRGFPRPGSSAEHLTKTLKTQDFIWRDNNGAEVLCHWNAFNYGQGDMINALGIMRMYLMPVFRYWHNQRFINRQIKGFIKALSKYRKTPYMFCPIGFDFVPPIPRFIEAIDGYNATLYPKNGVYAVNATLEDYMMLIDQHRATLPVVELDPNPYWTGFYTARPAMKKRCFQLGRHLQVAESALALNGKTDDSVKAKLDEAWWLDVATNHHDFITGTSPDRIFEDEGFGWIDRGLDLCEAIHPIEETVSDKSGPAPQVSEHAGSWRIENEFYWARVSGQLGHIIEFHDKASDSISTISGPFLQAYRDSGGLWRMGMEFKGGVFKKTWDEREDGTSMDAEIIQSNGMVEVRKQFEIEGETLVRSLYFTGDSPIVFGKLHGRAPVPYSLTLAMDLDSAIGSLRMAQPGGVVERAREQYYQPTFWPAQEFCSALDSDGESVFSLLFNQPGAVAIHNGRLEFVTHRNAPRETAYRFIPIPANPAKGVETLHCQYEFGLDFRAVSDPQESRQQLLTFSAFEQAALEQRWQTNSAGIEISGLLDAEVLAIKRSEDGNGIVVRLFSLENTNGEPAQLTLTGRTINEAYLCDVRETIGDGLEITEDAVSFTPEGAISSLYLVVS